MKTKMNRHPDRTHGEDTERPIVAGHRSYALLLFIHLIGYVGIRMYLGIEGQRISVKLSEDI